MSNRTSSSWHTYDGSMNVKKIFTMPLFTVERYTSLPHCCWLGLVSHVTWFVQWKISKCDVRKGLSCVCAMEIVHLGFCHCHRKNTPCVAHWFQNKSGTQSRGWSTGLQLEAKPSQPIYGYMVPSWTARLTCRFVSKIINGYYYMPLNSGVVYCAARADWYRNLYQEMSAYVSKNPKTWTWLRKLLNESE